MEGKDLILEKDGHVAILTLNRPEKMNAISLEMRRDDSPGLAGDPGGRQRPGGHPHRRGPGILLRGRRRRPGGPRGRAADGYQPENASRPDGELHPGFREDPQADHRRGQRGRGRGRAHHDPGLRHPHRFGGRPFLRHLGQAGLDRGRGGDPFTASHGGAGEGPGVVLYRGGHRREGGRKDPAGFQGCSRGGTDDPGERARPEDRRQRLRYPWSWRKGSCGRRSATSSGNSWSSRVTPKMSAATPRTRKRR